jgi:hypothetical protein
MIAGLFFKFPQSSFSMFFSWVDETCGKFETLCVGSGAILINKN